MALIEFTDLPNTTTPITAENLNNNFNYLNEKNYIQVKPLTDYTLAQSSTYYTVPFSQEMFSEGDKLTIENGNIKIGAGVSRIKISLEITYVTSATGSKNGYIQKNSNNIKFLNTYASSTSIYASLVISDFITDVEENDIISFGVYGSQNDIINAVRTYATIEVIK